MIPCNSTNYQAGRAQRIQFIVVHYTAGDGDSARGNCVYFQRNPGLYASAHYFVDEAGWEQSVADEDTAWHCGANTYKHPLCRNANSIGVELCSRKDAAGKYFFAPATVDQAVKLVQSLMDKHGVDARHVLRHYDVTGKKCPAPFVDDPKAWAAFKERLEDTMTYETFKEYMDQYLEGLAAIEPDQWSHEAREWAESRGIIQGNTRGQKKYKAFLTREEMAQMLYRAMK